MKHLILLSFILISNYINAQITVTGKVTDANNQAIEFANVVLLNTENKEIVTGTITDEKGNFTVKTDKKGAFSLQISFIGFENYTKGIDANTDLGNITLKNDTELSEVVITTKKPLIERKVDRLVLNVENTTLSSGKSSLDILSISPNVWISNSGRITLNGVQGVKILINGILLKLSGNQLTSYLNSLKSFLIKRIEIIANPPAEYEAEGSAGLINIVLKKSRKDGLTGNVFTSYKQGRYPYFANGFNMSYKIHRIGFYGGYYFIKNKVYTDLSQTRIFKNTNILIKTTSKSIPKIDNQQVRFGVDYELTKNQYLGGEFVGTINDKKTSFKSISEIYNTQIDSTVVSDFNLLPKNKFYNATVNYNIELDTLGMNLKILSDYIYNDSSEKNHFNSDYFKNNLTFKSVIYKNNLKTISKIFSSKIDFYKPLKKSQLNLGLKYSNTSIENNIVYENFDNNLWDIDSNKSNLFNYKESIFASYVSYTTRILGMDTKFGLRGEYSSITGNSATTKSDIPPKNKYDIFPSIFLKYSLNENKGNSLSFYYGKRISRPSFENLNPFVFQIDNFSASVGNQNLQPQYSNTVQLGFDYHRKYSLSLFFSKISDVFTQIAINKGDNILIYQVQNLNNSINYGSSANIPIRFAKWWNSYNNVSLYDNSYSFDSFSNNRLIFESKTSHYFSLPKDWRLELKGGYRSKSIQGNYVIDPTYYVDFGIRKYFLKKKIRTIISVTDIFKTRNSNLIVNSNDLGLSAYQEEQTRTILLSVNYNFSIGKKIKVKRTESGNWDERGRL